jgi:phenylpropionate dioxygenase-like ring-hydroxylating dioxygenase large terminal subunit
MQHAQQVAILKRLLAHVEAGTTQEAEAPWRNHVGVYTSPERLARETDRLFRRRPLLVGMSADWPQPGDYRTDDFAGVPMLIARGRDGALRAFLNVCRHRGAKVARRCGKASVFSCPYHAWTYDLEGRIRGIPEERSFPGVRAERPGLTPLPLAEKHGMVFVIATPAADGATAFDIEPWLEGLGPELAGFGFSSYHFWDRRVVEEEMNWKVLVDTFHESYHIGFLHRDSLTGILHTNVADFEPFGPNHRLVFPRTKLERLKSEPESGWDLMWNTAAIYTLFPNTVFVVQGDHIEIHRIYPRDGRPDRAVMETSLYVPKPPATAEEREHWQKNMDLVMRVVTEEDFPAGRSMQIGFGSGAQSHVVFGRNEPAMIHFHRSLERELAHVAATG